MNILYQKFLLKSIADLLDGICGRYFSLFLYYNIFFYFFHFSACVINITVLKEFPPQLYFIIKFAKSQFPWKSCRKRYFLLAVVTSGLTQQEQNQRVRVQNFGAASRICERWFPAPRAKVGMEKFAYGVATTALSRGPGNFGIFLRFCEVIVAMKKFAYGVNAGKERAASPKGGPANWFLGITSIIT